MGGTTTTYAIEVLYRARDQASKQIDSIGRSADGASRSVGGLGSTLSRLATGLAGFGVLRAAKSHFIDFNSSVEGSTISLAAQEKMLLGGRWDTAMSHATGLFAEYQKVAANSVGETRDFIAMHQGIASSAYRAGLGMEQLKQMTIGATIAATALGERADMVSLDIKQMLAGDVTSRDRTAQILLASQGVGQSQFNAMSQKKRNAVVMRALNDPALKAAANAYGQSFAGVTSTLKDNLSIMLGKVGLPLFRAITAEVKKWNAWIEKNPDKIRQFAADFTSALRDGLEAVKKIAGFIVDNRELLMTLAKAYLVGKGVSMLAGGVASGVSSIAGFATNIAKLGGAGVGGLGGLITAVSRFNAALAVVTGTVAGAQYIADRVDSDHEQNLKTSADLAVALGHMHDVARARGSEHVGSQFSGRDADYAVIHGAAAARERVAERMLEQARSTGLVSGRFGFDTEGFDRARYGSTVSQNQQWFAYADALKVVLEEQRRAWLAKPLDIRIDPGQLAFSLGAGLRSLWETMLPSALSDSDRKKEQKPPNPNVKVEIKVASDDPDRFAVALSDVVADALKNPRGARRVMREA